MNWLKNNWGWGTTIVIAILPLIGILSMINLDFSGNGPWFSMDSVTVPSRQEGGTLREIPGAHLAVKETGEWAIRWLVIVLSLTPFSILTGIKPGIHVRQVAGVTAFTYAALHLVFFCIDRGLPEVFSETGYVLGLSATLIMLILAITSNKRSMRFLRKTWKKVHRFAYLAGILAVIHVMLLEHGEWFPYAVILIAGFLFRVPYLKNVILNFRKKVSVALY